MERVFAGDMKPGCTGREAKARALSFPYSANQAISFLRNSDVSGNNQVADNRPLSSACPPRHRRGEDRSIIKRTASRGPVGIFSAVRKSFRPRRVKRFFRSGSHIST